MIFRVEFKVLVLFLLGTILCLAFCSCFVPKNAERFRFQIPALLDVDVELKPEKAETPPPKLSDIFPRKG